MPLHRAPLEGVRARGGGAVYSVRVSHCSPLQHHCPRGDHSLKARTVCAPCNPVLGRFHLFWWYNFTFGMPKLKMGSNGAQLRQPVPRSRRRPFDSVACVLACSSVLTASNAVGSGLPRPANSKLRAAAVCRETHEGSHPRDRRTACHTAHRVRESWASALGNAVGDPHGTAPPPKRVVGESTGQPSLQSNIWL